MFFVLFCCHAHTVKAIFSEVLDEIAALWGRACPLPPKLQILNFISISVSLLPLRQDTAKIRKSEIIIHTWNSNNIYKRTFWKNTILIKTFSCISENFAPNGVADNKVELIKTFWQKRDGNCLTLRKKMIIKVGCLILKLMTKIKGRPSGTTGVFDSWNLNISRTLLFLFVNWWSTFIPLRESCKWLKLKLSLIAHIYTGIYILYVLSGSIKIGLPENLDEPLYMLFRSLITLT